MGAPVSPASTPGPLAWAPGTQPSNITPSPPGQPPEREVTCTSSSLAATGLFTVSYAPSFSFVLSQTPHQSLNSTYQGLHVLTFYWVLPANPVCKTSHLFVSGSKCDKVLSPECPHQDRHTVQNPSILGFGHQPLSPSLFPSTGTPSLLDSPLPVLSEFLQQSPQPLSPQL